MIEFENGYTIEVFKGPKSVLIVTAQENGPRVSQEYNYEDFAKVVAYLVTQVGPQ